MVASLRLIGGMGGVGDLNGGWFRDDNGNGRYKVVSGDTINTITNRWLGSGRAYELWNLQPWRNDSYHAGNIDRIRVGDVMVMPPDAVAKAEQLGVLEAGDAFGSLPDFEIPYDDGGVLSIPEVTIYGSVPQGNDSGAVIDLGDVEDWTPEPVVPAPVPMPQIPGVTAPAGSGSAPVAGADGKPVSGGLSLGTMALIAGGLLVAAGVGVALFSPGGGNAYRVVVGSGKNQREVGTFSNYEKALKIAAANGGVVVHDSSVVTSTPQPAWRGASAQRGR